MNRRILITEDANLDLQEHFNYLAQNNRDPLMQHDKLLQP
jgi:hypothetical protein